MALIEQDATTSRHPSSPQTRTGPDYEAEADRDRLKLHDDHQPQESSLQSPPRTLAEEILAGFGTQTWNRRTSLEVVADAMTAQ